VSRWCSTSTVTSNLTNQAAQSGWRSLGDSESLIVGYPLGLFGQTAAAEVDTALGPSWNAGKCCGGASQNGIDDVGFARAIVQAVAAEANVDRTRVYAAGHSNGGSMSYRLGCEAADLFAGVAPVAGLFLFVPAPCQPARPIPVIAFGGLHDPQEPYALVTADFTAWRHLQGCGSGPPDDRVDIGTSYCEIYRSCNAKARLLVSTQTTTVLIRLAFTSSRCSTSAGWRNPGSEPRGSAKSTHQICPRRIIGCGSG